VGGERINQAHGRREGKGLKWESKGEDFILTLRKSLKKGEERGEKILSPNKKKKSLSRSSSRAPAKQGGEDYSSIKKGEGAASRPHREKGNRKESVLAIREETTKVRTTSLPYGNSSRKIFPLFQEKKKTFGNYKERRKVVCAKGEEDFRSPAWRGSCLDLKWRRQGSMRKGNELRDDRGSVAGKRNGHIPPPDRGKERGGFCACRGGKVREAALDFVLRGGLDPLLRREEGGKMGHA